MRVNFRGFQEEVQKCPFVPTPNPRGDQLENGPGSPNPQTQVPNPSPFGWVTYPLILYLLLSTDVALTTEYEIRSVQTAV